MTRDVIFDENKVFDPNEVQMRAQNLQESEAYFPLARHDQQDCCLAVWAALLRASPVIFIEPAVEIDDVPVVETTYEKTGEVSGEERELADLEAKKIKRGRLVLKKDWVCEGEGGQASHNPMCLASPPICIVLEFLGLEST